MVGLLLERTRPKYAGLWRIVANCSLFCTLLDNEKSSKGAAKPQNMLQKVSQTYIAPFGKYLAYQDVKVHNGCA